MASSPDPSRAARDRRWFIVGRWQEYEGEARANFLRIAGIAAFYVVELVNYFGLDLGFIEMPKVVDLAYHQAITALAAAWVAVALGVLFCLQQRVFPLHLKYVTAALDLVLMTGVLAVSDGPRSPLVVGYLLLITLAALRFSRGLVWFTSAGAVAGYAVLLGYARWFTDRDLRVPRYAQIIFLLAIVLAGVIVGQVVRRVRALAEDYAARAQSGEGTPP